MIANNSELMSLAVHLTPVSLYLSTLSFTELGYICFQAIFPAWKHLFIFIYFVLLSDKC